MIIDKIRQMFQKKKSPREFLDKHVEVGNIVTLTLKNLNEIGIYDPGGNLSKRFDPEDIKTMSLTGTLMNRFNNGGIDFIELICVKGSFGAKHYVILVDEIQEIKKLT